MTTNYLIRIGSKIFNPRTIIICEPVKIWVYETYEHDGSDGREIEAMKICLMGQHDLIITPEEWQGVKRLLDILLALPEDLPKPPVDQSAADDFKDERL